MGVTCYGEGDEKGKAKIHPKRPAKDPKDLDRIRIVEEDGEYWVEGGIRRFIERL